MARTIRNAKIDTRSARAKLQSRREPYWTPVSQGCSVGYRKGVKGGTWIARWRDPDGKQHYRSLGPADDALDADGVNALAFAQAQERARAWFADQARGLGEDGRPGGPYTVADAMADYMAWFREHRKGVAVTQYNINAHILPKLGDVEMSKLTRAKLRSWHAGLAATPARLRTRPGNEQRFRESDGGPDAARPRRATANRVLVVLKAALNHAWREGRIESDDAWRRVAPYREADSARVRYLARDECKRLVNACDPSLRRLVSGALYTGCRYGELAAMRVSDFNPDSGTVTVARSKAGKVRHVVLTEEGRTFFETATAGRAGDALIFTRSGGGSWGRAHQHRPLRAACERAKITPSISFHVLRHTYASLAVMASISLQVVAINLGHADTRMVERHYGHMSKSHVADVIRAAMPRLGLDEASTVERFRRTR